MPDASLNTPDESPVFADRASPRLTRRWRRFTPYDICCESGLRALIVTERQGDVRHICIAQDSTDNVISITAVFERLATVLYRDACLDAEIAASRRTLFRNWIDWIRHVFQSRRNAIDPELFRFYQYFPQNGAYPGSPESFSRVSLRFDADQRAFRKRDWSDWRGIRDVPDAIRSAFADAGRIITVTQRGREPVVHPIVGATRNDDRFNFGAKREMRDDEKSAA